MRYLLVLLMLLSFESSSSSKSICGASDDREESNDPRIARILRLKDNAVCTATLIGKSCMLTAGHCTVALDLVEFDIPKSTGGNIVNSIKENQYMVDRSYLISPDNLRHNDWAVFKLFPNEVTGIHAGVKRGYYEVSFDSVNIGDPVRVTGFGKDKRASRNFTQQVHSDFLVDISRGISKLHYRVDTMGGDSGAAIISENSDKIIGVHTDRGCFLDKYSNSGIATSLNQKLERAIIKCIQSEEE